MLSTTSFSGVEAKPFPATPAASGKQEGDRRQEYVRMLFKLGLRNNNTSFRLATGEKRTPQTCSIVLEAAPRGGINTLRGQVALLRRARFASQPPNVCIR